MKSYLLLRDNRESGPHSFEKISSLGLRPLDLVWINDESTCWKYPEEIEELKPLIKYEEVVLPEKKPLKQEKVFILLPSNFTQRRKPELTRGQARIPVHQAEPVLETNFVKPHDELKENYRTKQKAGIWDKRLFQSTNHASVAAIFIGVVLGAIIIKKFVDGSVPVTSYKAATVATPIIDRQPAKQANEDYQNALVTEIVPVYKAPSKKPKSTHIRNQLKITASKYKVGLFGGINGLQLTVFNTSSQMADKVVVALDYLRQNGEVVQSENVLFTSIRPKGSRTISIPGSNRGVKVKYKILKVYAHDYKADLKQI